MASLHNILEIVVVTIFLFWYLKFLWGRRKLYYHSWSVPGPLAFPLIGAAYVCFGDPEETLNNVNKCMAKYPSPVKLWLGHRLLYGLTDPEHIEKVLTNKNCMDKGDLYRFVSDVVGNGLVVAPVALWRKNRKTIMPSFNQKVLDSFVDIFTEQATILTKVLEEYVGNHNKNISQSISAFALDTVCEAATGLKMNTQRGVGTFATHMDRLQEIICLRIFNVWHHLDWIWKFHPLSKRFEKHLQGLRETTSTVVLKKMKEFQLKKQHSNISLTSSAEVVVGHEKRKAFLDLILESSEFTEKELRDEVEVFLVAGTDTTAAATCFFLEMCGLFPDIQQKVYEEVVEVLGEDRLVEPSDLPKLQYVERVLKETLRLFPLGPHILRTISEDVDLGRYVLPKGSTALVSVLNVHRDPKYWPEPLKFDPDRFLPEEVAKRHPCAYIPFSYGPRNCIGGKFAMMALKTAAATIITKYRVFTRYKSLEEIDLSTKLMLKPKNGYKFYIEPR